MVIDNGPGISDDILPSLFEPFAVVRPGDFSEDEERGSGLGLCMAQILASAMETKITVHTKVGKGCCFNILLTLQVCPSFEKSISGRKHHSQQKRFGAQENSDILHKSSNEQYVQKSLQENLHHISCPSNGLFSHFSRESSLSNRSSTKRKSNYWNLLFKCENSLESTKLGKFSKATRHDRSSAAGFGAGNSTVQIKSSKKHFSECSVGALAGMHLTDNGDLSIKPGSFKEKCSSRSLPSMSEKVSRKSQSQLLQSSRSMRLVHVCPTDTETPGCRHKTKQELRTAIVINSPGPLFEPAWAARCLPTCNSECKLETAGLEIARSDKSPVTSYLEIPTSLRKNSKVHYEEAKSLAGILEPARPHQGHGNLLPIKRTSAQTQLTTGALLENPSLFQKKSVAKNGQASSVVHPLTSKPTSLGLLRDSKVQHEDSENLASGSSFFISSSQCSVNVEKVTGQACSLVAPLEHNTISIPSISKVHRDQSEHLTEEKCPQPKKKILIVDDVRSNAKLAEMIVKQAGYCCDLAYNGLEAVNAVRSQQFDLILMDNVMPVMNGVQATQEILRFKPEAIIVGMTANILQKDQDEFLKAGARLILAKPVERTQLLQTCARFCSASIA